MMLSKLLILFFVLLVLTIALFFITNLLIDKNEKQIGLTYKILGGVNGTVLGMIASIISYWLIKNALITFWGSIPVILFGAVMGCLIGVLFHTQINKCISNTLEIILEIFSSTQH